MGGDLLTSGKAQIQKVTDLVSYEQMGRCETGQGARVHMLCITVQLLSILVTQT